MGASIGCGAAAAAAAANSAALWGSAEPSAILPPLARHAFTASRASSAARAAAPGADTTGSTPLADAPRRYATTSSSVKPTSFTTTVDSCASHSAYAAAAAASNVTANWPAGAAPCCSAARFAAAAATDTYESATRTVTTTVEPASGAAHATHAPSDPVLPEDDAFAAGGARSAPSAQSPVNATGRAAPLPEVAETTAKRYTGTPPQSRAKAPDSVSEALSCNVPSPCGSSATLPGPQPWSCVRWQAFRASTLGAASPAAEKV